MKRKHYRVEDIGDFCQKVLEKGGYSPKVAEATTYALLEADKKGVFSHGIAGTGLDANVKRWVEGGKINLEAEPKIQDSKYPTIVTIDADKAPGHYTSMLACEIAKERARKFGFGKVYVHNANHYGAAGVWSEKIAEDKDLSGIVTCITPAFARVMGDDPKMVDYTKGMGTRNRVGTNPQAVSFPHQNGILTYDSACTKMAVSLIMNAFKAGEMLTIPHYGVNNDNQSTLNTKEILDLSEGFKMIGSVFPTGSEHTGYKGDCDGRMREIDNGLGGGPIYGHEPGNRYGASHTFQAQAIDFLFSEEEALARISEQMRDYEKYFGENSRWPGDRAKKAVEYSIIHGIPYSEGHIKTLTLVGDDFGVPFNLTPSNYKEFPEDVFKK